MVEIVLDTRGVAGLVDIVGIIEGVAAVVVIIRIDSRSRSSRQTSGSSTSLGGKSGEEIMYGSVRILGIIIASAA